MNIQTLLSLKKNPHYKFTQAQQELLDQYEREKQRKIVEFGVPPIHNTAVPVREKGLPKRKRTSKNT